MYFEKVIHLLILINKCPNCIYYCPTFTQHSAMAVVSIVHCCLLLSSKHFLLLHLIIMLGKLSVRKAEGAAGVSETEPVCP